MLSLGCELEGHPDNAAACLLGGSDGQLPVRRRSRDRPFVAVARSVCVS